MSSVSKYEALVAAVRIQTGYLPAGTPYKSITERTKKVEFVKEVVMLKITLVGEVHAVEETKNACKSLLTSRRLAPTTLTVCCTPLNTGITLGESEVKERIVNTLAWEYGDRALHRTHN